MSPINNAASAYSDQNSRRDALHSPLSNKRVAIVGLGGAAECSLDLLRSGVTHFSLFDDDVLESGNLVRHVCGSEHVGKNKAVATKELLERYAGGPLENVIAIAKSVFDGDAGFEKTMERCDLVIVGTDTDASRKYVSDVALRKGVKTVTASMFENGCGGEIFSHSPGGACYSCLLLHLERHEFVDRYETLGPKSECHSARDVSKMPGIGIDQRFLSLIASRKALDLLLENERHSLPDVGPNWIVFSISGISDILENPLSSRRESLPPHPDCHCRKNQ